MQQAIASFVSSGPEGQSALLSGPRTPLEIFGHDRQAFVEGVIAEYSRKAFDALTEDNRVSIRERLAELHADAEERYTATSPAP